MGRSHTTLLQPIITLIPRRVTAQRLIGEVTEDATLVVISKSRITPESEDTTIVAIEAVDVREAGNAVKGVTVVYDSLRVVAEVHHSLFPLTIDCPPVEELDTLVRSMTSHSDIGLQDQRFRDTVHRLGIEQYTGDEVTRSLSIVEEATPHTQRIQTPNSQYQPAH